MLPATIAIVGNSKYPSLGFSHSFLLPVMNYPSLAKANRLFDQGNLEEALSAYQAILQAESPLAIKRLARQNIHLLERRLCLGSRHSSFPTHELFGNKSPFQLEQTYQHSPIISIVYPSHAELISVIIPLYNNEKYIRTAINSCLSQVGVKLEIVVVDDGSTDNSLQEACSAAAGYNNVKIISLLRNFGCYYARNMALLNSSGDYIALLDSDDIMEPERLLIQLEAIKETSSAIASQSLCAKWSSSYSSRLAEPRYAENSLLWSRSVIEKMGYYDSVRYGGDSEFRCRLISVYGINSLVRIDKELYHIRTVSNSLTTSGGGSSAFALEEGKLALQLSDERKFYARCFESLLNAPVRSLVGPRSAKYMPFPLCARKFSLGCDSQNASKSLNQHVVGALASYPPRIESLERMVGSIVDQVDRLVVYLNEYEEVPGFLDDPRIEVFQSQFNRGNLRDNGKFFLLESLTDSYVFTLDDDIVYPGDYVARMAHYIEVLERRCVVGCHGVVFPGGSFESLEQRLVLHYAKATPGLFVDLLGSGTTAWHSSLLRPRLEEFRSQGVCDLWLSSIALRSNIPMFCIPKGGNWLHSPIDQDESLWLEAKSNSDHYFKVFREEIDPFLDHGRVRISAESDLFNRYSRQSLECFGYRNPPLLNFPA